MTQDRIYHTLERIEKKMDEGFTDMGKRVTSLEVWKAQAMVVFVSVTIILNLVWETAKTKFKL